MSARQVHAGGREFKLDSRWASVLCALLGFVGGCADRPHVSPDSPEMAWWLDAMLPRSIKIAGWTKPISYAEDGNPDALEVVLEAKDGADDLTTIAGTLHFELLALRSTESLGRRVGFWEIAIKSPQQAKQYRDVTQLYQFPLKLDEPPLRRGRFALQVQLTLPTGTRLTDEYKFTYDGSPVPPPRPTWGH